MVIFCTDGNVSLILGYLRKSSHALTRFDAPIRDGEETSSSRGHSQSGRDAACFDALHYTTAYARRSKLDGHGLGHGPTDSGVLDTSRPVSRHKGVKAVGVIPWVLTVSLIAVGLLAAATVVIRSPAAADVLERCSSAFDPADALSACDEIISSSWSTDQQMAIAFNNRGNAHDYLGRTQAAIDDYSRVLALEPHSINARYNRATAYLAINDLPNAIADFNSVLKLEPRRPDALNNRGLALLRRGDLDQAIEDFSSALRMDAAYAYAHNNRGVAWRRKGESQRAIDDFTRAIELEPGYAAALNSRGELRLAMGDREAAIRDFRRALLANPEHPAAKRNLESVMKPEAQSGPPR